ncbi:MAG: hypothetical protein NC200_03450, partial [Candidatus Gastranaerophilales bacterium]|nr:hypothetical protein [Candidatus Gastranaerophilales bacterium]
EPDVPTSATRKKTEASAGSTSAEKHSASHTTSHTTAENASTASEHTKTSANNSLSTNKSSEISADFAITSHKRSKSYETLGDSSSSSSGTNVEHQNISTSSSSEKIFAEIKNAKDRADFTKIRDKIKQMKPSDEKTKLMHEYQKRYSEWSSSSERPDIRMEYTPDKQVTKNADIITEITAESLNSKYPNRFRDYEIDELIKLSDKQPSELAKLLEVRWNDNKNPVFEYNEICELLKCKNIDNVIDIANIRRIINGEEYGFNTAAIIKHAENIDNIKFLAELTTEINGQRYCRFGLDDISKLANSDMFNVKKLAEIKWKNGSLYFNADEIAELAQQKNIFNIIKLANIQENIDGNLNGFSNKELIYLAQKDLDVIDKLTKLADITYTNKDGNINSRFTNKELFNFADTEININNITELANIRWNCNNKFMFNGVDIIRLSKSKKFDNLIRLANIQKPNKNGGFSRFDNTKLLELAELPQKNLDELIKFANIKQKTDCGKILEVPYDDLCTAIKPEYINNLDKYILHYRNMFSDQAKYYDHFYNLKTKSGNRIFTGRDGRMDEIEVLDYMVNMILRDGQYALKSDASIKMLTSMVQDELVDPHVLKYLPKEGETNPLIAAEIHKFYEAYLNRIPFEDVLVPNVHSLEEAASKIKKGNVFNINGEKNIYIKNADGTSTQLSIDKEMYCKLFPPIERYASTQNDIGNCWQITGFNSLLRDMDEVGNVLKCFKQDGNDIIISFPNRKLDELRFKNGELPAHCNLNGYSEGALGLRLLEYTHAKERQAARIAEASKEMSPSNYKRFLEHYNEYNGNVFLREEEDSWGRNYWEWSKGGIDEIYKHNKSGCSNDVWDLLGYSNTRDLSFNGNPTLIRNILNDPNSFNENLIGWASKNNGVSESAIANEKGIVSGHAYTLKANVDENNNIIDYNLLNPWGILETTLSKEEVINLGMALYIAKRR